MKLPAGQVLRCRCCGQVLCSASPDGSRIIIRCHNGTDTVLVACIGVIEVRQSGSDAADSGRL